MTTTHIPLMNLHAQYRELRGEIRAAIERLLEEQHFILGPSVESFEKQAAKYFALPEAIGLASGSDALYLSLAAFGIGPGDEVITTPFTFFATAGAIARTGARPLFVDIDPRTFNLDPGRLSACLEERAQRAPEKVKAVIPVHLFGHPAEMNTILPLAREHGMKVIEDACQAIGATYRGKKAGTIGDCGCFSFFPSKNLGGYGDGGLLVTGDPDFAGMIRRLRVHGSDRKYHHVELGINSRLDALQAAVLAVKLPHLDRWNAARRERARCYHRLLSGIPDITLPPSPEEGVDPVFHLYVIRSRRRDELASFLHGRGISTGVYYPVPLHLQPCFHDLGYREGDFPEAEKASREVLALPLFPELREEEQELVSRSIGEFFQGR